MSKLSHLLVDWIISRAQRTPYLHLHKGDELYMARYWLVAPGWLPFGINARVHHIAQPDADRAMHDHPWNFVSIVLRGWYHEARPVGIEPGFEGEQEWHTSTTRGPGDFAYRRSTDRHRITRVGPGGALTLFITGPRLHWWGFYTPAGKIHWRDYAPRKEVKP